MLLPCGTSNGGLKPADTHITHFWAHATFRKADPWQHYSTARPRSSPLTCNRGAQHRTAPAVCRYAFPHSPSGAATQLPSSPNRCTASGNPRYRGRTLARRRRLQVHADQRHLQARKQVGPSLQRLAIQDTDYGRPGDLPFAARLGGCQRRYIQREHVQAGELGGPEPARQSMSAAPTQSLLAKPTLYYVLGLNLRQYVPLFFTRCLHFLPVDLSDIHQKPLSPRSIL